MRFLTVNDIARICGKSPQTIRLLARDGHLPFVKAYRLEGSNRYGYIVYPEIAKEYLGKEFSGEESC